MITQRPPLAIRSPLRMTKAIIERTSVRNRLAPIPLAHQLATDTHHRIPIPESRSLIRRLRLASRQFLSVLVD